jgi:hypothetical protein
MMDKSNVKLKVNEEEITLQEKLPNRNTQEVRISRSEQGNYYIEVYNVEGSDICGVVISKEAFKQLIKEANKMRYHDK